MGYCSLSQCDSLLNQAQTSSVPHDVTGGKISLWVIGNSRNRNEIPDDIVYQYIRWADDEINSNLSAMYKVPLFKVSLGEWYLEQDIDEYNPTNIVVSDATSLVPGDEILIISTAFNPPIKEKHIVKEIIDDDEFTVEEPIFTNFPAGEDTRVTHIGYNPAITLISCRRTTGAIFDKYLSGQAAPDISDYGNKMRELALSAMSDILNGTIILHGQERIANRFAQSNLYDRFSVLNRQGNESREFNSK